MKKIQQYLSEVVQELKKVTWPTQDELKGSTLVVIVFSIAMAVFIGLSDFLLNGIMSKILEFARP